MTDQILNTTTAKFKDALDFLHAEFGKLQTGRASAALVEGVLVESYGTKVPLKGVANISIPESNQIAIQPWNRDQLPDIEKAITDAGIGLNPLNDGIAIRLTLPPMTEDRRKDLVKLVHKYAEDARISIRNARHEALNQLKNLEKNKEIGEDVLHDKEKEIQDKVDEYNKQVEEVVKHKEVDITTV